jgi:hypothetical protein
MLVLILVLAVLVLGFICIYSACKREDSYWDWLANYNLSKKRDDTGR